MCQAVHTPRDMHSLVLHMHSLALHSRSRVQQPVAMVPGVSLSWVLEGMLWVVDRSWNIYNDRVSGPGHPDGSYYKPGRQNEPLPHLRYSHIHSGHSRVRLGSWPNLGLLLILP